MAQSKDRLSFDEQRIAWIEKMFFEAYNESDVQVGAINNTVLDRKHFIHLLKNKFGIIKIMRRMKKNWGKKRILIILFLTFLLFGCEKSENILEDIYDYYIEDDENFCKNIQNADNYSANIISNMFAEEGKVEVDSDTNFKYDFAYSYYIP